MTTQFEKQIREELEIVIAKEETLRRLLDVYGSPVNTNGFGSDEVSKSDRYKHELRRMMRELKPYHINDIKDDIKSRNITWNKAVAHQAIKDLHADGELIKVKINGSNQRYYYMSANAKNGGKYLVKDHFLPMEKVFIDTIEIIE